MLGMLVKEEIGIMGNIRDLGDLVELLAYMLGLFLVMFYFTNVANRTLQKKYFIIGALLQLWLLVGHTLHRGIILESKILAWIVYFVLLFKYLRKKKSNS